MPFLPPRLSHAVVKPETSGPGGDLFALVSMKKTGKVEALNSSGPAPAKATIDYFHGRGLKGIPQFGPLSIAVPGAVDGWLELHKKYGTKELGRLTADAVRIAREGFPISQEFAEGIDEISPNFPWVDRLYRAASRHAESRERSSFKRAWAPCSRKSRLKGGRVSMPGKSPTKSARRSRPRAAFSPKKICGASCANGSSR